MKWSDNMRSQFIKIAWITFAWTIFSFFQFLTSYSTFVDYKLADQIDASIPLRASIFAGILGGILGGSAIVFLWEKWLRARPYGWTIRNLLISYTIIFVLVAFPSNVFFQSRFLEQSPLSTEVLIISAKRLTYATTLVPFFTWLAVVSFTTIALLVNDKYGPGVFKKFLLGRYFKPKREERIFMFLDLRSSTMIAEEMGEEKYFSFLRDVFRYATPAILKFKGEIYQYVGDEIVISWELANGAKNANCIQCYFEIQEDLDTRKSYFLEKYDTHPEFKAGIHYGHVMAGEIGVVKREIAFSGDVLNTTSRIQSKCNELGVDILASGAVIELLDLKNIHEPRRIGEIELRGKKELVTLFTV